MGVFEQPSYDGHEEVQFVRDEDSGLRAIVAIHSTRLGPAAGGCRMWTYANEAAAVDDALRLSRGMSYKNAVAGLPLGGGKTVIFGGPGGNREALFKSFGAAVERLNGRYITAEDVGVSVRDMQCVAQSTRYVAGLPARAGATGKAGGDPSPKTARGVFHGIQAAVQHALKRSDLQGIRVAVQGLGAVGQNLCRELHDAGATLLVADLDRERVAQMQELYRAQPRGVNEILFEQVDVVAPCALGGIVNANSIPKLNTGIIAGGANNQLLTGEDGERLRRLGILYAPDYVINAGGIVNAAAEYLGTDSEETVWKSIANIHGRLLQIFEEADHRGVSTHLVADELARRIIGGRAN